MSIIAEIDTASGRPDLPRAGVGPARGYGRVLVLGRRDEGAKVSPAAYSVMVARASRRPAAVVVDEPGTSMSGSGVT